MHILFVLGVLYLHCVCCKYVYHMCCRFSVLLGVLYVYLVCCMCTVCVVCVPCVLVVLDGAVCGTYLPFTI